ncbi:MAG TPA: hypothetical protein VGC18_12175 [Lacisediminihabitans sp.]|uniref:hypothetical protein n=1 Tax=Lacisediminihabitans sp. TaxID=2787631 RepID=UPI002ED91E2E
MSTDVIHVITPGDHYSPRTGSAIPSVVHGLASAARAAGDDADFPPYVMVDGSTMHPRYDSALPIEYPGEPRPGRTQRYADVIGSRLGRARTNAVRYIRPLARELRLRRSGIVVAHNLPVLSSLLDDGGHRVVLYAHNDILRSYSRRELDRTLGGMEVVVCVSRSLAATTAGRLPTALAAKVRVVTSGADCRR